MGNHQSLASKLTRTPPEKVRAGNMASTANCTHPFNPTASRVEAVRWLERQHCSQMWEGEPSLLVDAWTQLLVRPGDPLQLAAAKAKALASCMKVGVGDARSILDVFRSWHGFGGVAASPTQKHCKQYCLRILRSAADEFLHEFNNQCRVVPAGRAVLLDRWASGSTSGGSTPRSDEAAVVIPCPKGLQKPTEV